MGESRGGCLGLPVPNSPYGLCGRKATLQPTWPSFVTGLPAAVLLIGPEAHPGTPSYIRREGRNYK